jgi:hypothetical protein
LGLENAYILNVFRCSLKDQAKKISTKFKNLHRLLKMWHSQFSNLNSIIDNNKLMLSFLDVLEETRDLSLQEWNFKLLVQQNLDKLLEQQRVYWKQRGNIKWAKLGDENTKFFHTNATIRHNKSTIKSLMDQHGVEIFKHEDKAHIIWEAFKDRLGVSEFSHIFFDIIDLI